MSLHQQFPQRQPRRPLRRLSSFTFLATLLLLLAVSCAIVMRSFVLRRRFRRRVEEALAAGIILPQHPPRKRDFGEKPRLWDAWLTPTDTKWSSIMVRSSIIRVVLFSSLRDLLMHRFSSPTISNSPYRPRYSQKATQVLEG